MSTGITSPIRPLTRRLQDVVGLVATPLVPSDFVDLVAPLSNREQLRGRIVAIHPETRDSVTLEIQPGVGWRRHLPGQYLRIGIDIDGVRRWRAYSLTSEPQSSTVSVTVKAIPDGLVSTHLVRQARVGTLVHLQNPDGDFVLPQPAPVKSLFVAAGSGVTPIMGMLRGGATLADAVVVQVAPTRDDAIFRGELRHRAAAGQIRLIEHHDDQEGLLSAERLRHYVPDLAQRQTWACGPTGLLDLLEQSFGDWGHPELLHTERFRPTVLLDGDGGTVDFRSGASAEVAAGQTLLDAGENAGVLMPSGCRMGICFGCVVPLKQGRVRDLRDGSVTIAGDGEEVMIQTCITTAAGPCELSV